MKMKLIEHMNKYKIISWLIVTPFFDDVIVFYVSICHKFLFEISILPALMVGVYVLKNIN